MAESPVLTEAERDVMEHALMGGGREAVYRNYFNAGLGHHDYETWVALCERRLAFARGASTQVYFHITPAGFAAIEPLLKASQIPDERVLIESRLRPALSQSPDESKVSESSR